MCAIIDVNVVGQAFGDEHTRTPAGNLFRKWVNQRQGRLIVGGKLKRELARNSNFKYWLKEAVSSNRAKLIDDDEVARKVAILSEDNSFQSNDRHVIALAQISGARLLYSEDKNLQKDFRKKNLIDKPRGKVYSSPNHRHLFKRDDLCKRTD